MSTFDFLKRFWAYALSLLGLVGGYLVLQEAKVGWIIFPIGGVAAGLALMKPAIEATSRLRRYPRLVGDIARLQEERDKAQADAESLRREAEARWQAGVEEGRAQLRGASLSASLDGIPEISAVGMTTDGLLLTGEYRGTVAIVAGARFEVQVAATGEPKGIVEVNLVEDDAETVHMVCVERQVEAFWRALERRADEDPTPPRGIALAVPPTDPELPPLRLDRKRSRIGATRGRNVTAVEPAVEQPGAEAS